MGYRKIKPMMIHIDSLIEDCGLFRDTQEKPYQCLLRSKNIYRETGVCASKNCPLAWEADLEDMKKYDKDLYEEYKQEKCDPTEMGAGWMVQYREIV